MADPHSKGPSEKKNVWHSDRTHRQEQESRSILLNRLNSRIEELFVPLIVNKSQHICIIDPPWYPNVGDSAILLGELSFLKRKFPEAKLSFYDSRNYSSSADVFIEEATILLIHGGGNFGDTWPEHQDLRMRVLERFPHKPIIQMPQSIYFRDEANVRATSAKIRMQSNFILFVRDLNSLDFARRFFECEVFLAPDMAFAMPAITRKSSTVDYLCLLRTDKEVAIDHEIVTNTLRASGKSFEVCDWVAQARHFAARLDTRLNGLTRRYPAVTAPFLSSALSLRQHNARRRLLYGIELLSKGSIVVTDRLHAHILCCLLDIPHFVFDSLGGKISAFHATWTPDSPNTQIMTSPGEFSSQWNRVFKVDLRR
jgi:exopolysaccharide biosynthesis predicted pyruvyltransferase EpsI